MDYRSKRLLYTRPANVLILLRNKWLFKAWRILTGVRVELETQKYVDQPKNGLLSIASTDSFIRVHLFVVRTSKTIETNDH